MLERHVPAFVGVFAASSAASASASTASASSATSTGTASSASIPVGRDEMGLPDLNSIENFAATLVVAFGGWTIGYRVSFPTVSTIGSTLGARMGCVLGAFRVVVTISPMAEVLVGSMVGRR